MWSSSSPTPMPIEREARGKSCISAKPNEVIVALPSPAKDQAAPVCKWQVNELVSARASSYSRQIYKGFIIERGICVYK